jgi:hypothetical protein
VLFIKAKCQPVALIENMMQMAGSRIPRSTVGGMYVLAFLHGGKR